MNLSDDHQHMRHALNLARRHLGGTWPNPSVGCIIVKNNRVIGRGVTARGGRPHAETQALQQAGEQARGATVYVTLEPCAHEGQTPSCARVLVSSGVRRVVLGTLDPDLRTSGQGVNILRQSGVQVDISDLSEEAFGVHKGFILRQKRSRPFVTLKIATTQDGFTVVPDHYGRWITSSLARAHTHLERSMHDAVLVGVGTVLHDDPHLDARVPGFDHETVRVVLDSKKRTPDAAMLYNKDKPVWVIHENSYDLSAVLTGLAGRGINRILVEGGVRTLCAFLKSELWDHFLWYRAPWNLKPDDRALIDPIYRLGCDDPISKYGLQLIKKQRLEPDTLEIYTKSG